MNPLISAMNKAQTKTKTLNGAKAKTTTGSACLDLFASVGAMRGQDIMPAFLKAYYENEDHALRIALWSRDIRGGAGERTHFRNIIHNLAITHYQQARKLAKRIPDLGRWDDLLYFFDTPVWIDALNIIEQGIKDGHGLCAKWMPRKGIIAESIRKHLNLTPKQYRKTLVGLTKVVEQQMCANKWKEINYEHVPSKASQIYSKAFKRHDPTGYSLFKNKLITGEAKVNAGAVYPHEVMVFLGKDKTVANAQWNALPDFVPDNLSFLPIIDCSGSMGTFGWGTANTPINVAIGLGLYLSERNKSVFKNSFITFSNNPKMQTVNGSLSDRAHQMAKAEWGMSTDLQKVFEVLLTTAKKHNVKQEDMPNYLLIVSDMQFNACVKSNNNIKEIKRKYKEYGYTAPTLVFWNVNHHGNFQVNQDQENIILVSGFSPSIMKSILTGNTEDFTPYNQMIKTIMDDRYVY